MADWIHASFPQVTVAWDLSAHGISPPLLGLASARAGPSSPWDVGTKQPSAMFHVSTFTSGSGRDAPQRSRHVLVSPSWPHPDEPEQPPTKTANFSLFLFGLYLRGCGRRCVGDLGSLFQLGHPSRGHRPPPVYRATLTHNPTRCVPDSMHEIRCTI
jgi:hypothetical protein